MVPFGFAERLHYVLVVDQLVQVVQSANAEPRRHPPRRRLSIVCMCRSYVSFVSYG